jgi:hypothetical protein
MTDQEWLDEFLHEVVATVGCEHKHQWRLEGDRVTFSHFIRKGRHQWMARSLADMRADRPGALADVIEQFRLSCVSEETEASLAFKQGYHYGFEDASQPYRNLMSNVERGLLKIVETE